MRLGFSLVLSLAACAKPPAAVPELSLRLSPASLGREVQWVQRITVLHGDTQRSLEAQFEVDHTSVRLAAMALGQTLATLQWDGTTFQSSVSTHVPAMVTAERILSDVQLAFWPVVEIQKHLGPGFTLEETPHGRVVLFEQHVLTSVAYSVEEPWWKRVRLTHRGYGYALDIESAEVPVE